MTRDEVRELIVKAIDDSTQLIDFGDFTVSETDFDAASETVLAAFAARGLIIGEPVTLRDVFQRDAEHIGIGQTGIDDEGLALVRVVE